MKIIVNGLEINDAVSKVSKALPVKEVLPVLDCIKIVAENDKLTLLASDRDLTIEKTIDASVLISGSVLVPGRLFGEYIRNIAGDSEVILEIKDDRMFITSSRSECYITCRDASEYPDIEEIGGDKSFNVTESNLKDIIGKVIFSVATDETRPILKGIYLEAKGYTLSAVATDGYRFAMCKKPLENQVELVNATVPSRSMNELAKLLGDGEEVATVYIEKNNMMVTLPGTKLMTRLLTNGQYIKYDNLIPTEFVTTLTVNRADFEKSLAIASIMSRGEKSNLVLLDIEEYSMKISSTSEYGLAKEDVAISLNGKDIKCTYNSKYLNDCIKALSAETIKMDFARNLSCIITINNSDEVLYFILPVSIF